MSIPFSVPKQHHSTVQTFVFTYNSFFYNFEVLSEVYMAHITANSLSAPHLPNESTAFSVKEVWQRTKTPEDEKSIEKWDLLQV